MFPAKPGSRHHGRGDGSDDSAFPPGGARLPSRRPARMSEEVRSGAGFWRLFISLDEPVVEVRRGAEDKVAASTSLTAGEGMAVLEFEDSPLAPWARPSVPAQSRMLQEGLCRRRARPVLGSGSEMAPIVGPADRHMPPALATTSHQPDMR